MNVEEAISADKEIKSYLNELDIVYVNNLITNVKIDEKVEKGDFIYYSLTVEESYNYIDLPDIDSGEGYGVQVVFDKKSGKIIDKYSDSSSIDLKLRGEEFSFNKSSNMDTVKKTSSKILNDNSISSAKNMLINNIQNEMQRRQIQHLLLQA